MGAFIYPFTDWSFKFIFGREENKDILIEFLNDLLQGERVITDVRYMNNEQIPEQMEMRKVIYDIFCETDTGEHIIVEMQNRWQEHFKDRALFYMSNRLSSRLSQAGNGTLSLMPSTAYSSLISCWIQNPQNIFARMWHSLTSIQVRSLITNSARYTLNCPGS